MIFNRKLQIFVETSPHCAAAINMTLAATIFCGDCSFVTKMKARNIEIEAIGRNFGITNVGKVGLS